MAPDDLTTQPFYIILNAGSGRTETDLQRRIIEDELTRAGRRFELLVVEAPEALPQLAAQTVARAVQDGAIVVAAGGDGTINTVARAALASGCAFGVLPQGTFNYFARTHGIPQDLAAATRALLTARVQPVQVGRLNDRIFLVNASVGLYPTVLEQRERDKRQFGRSRLVAVLSAIKTILGFRRRLAIELDLNGVPQRVVTTTLFVGNNALQMERLGLDPARFSMEEGRLLAMAPQAVGKLATLGLLLRGALRRLGEAPDVVSFGFRRMVVNQHPWYPKRTVKVAVDGEVTRVRPPLEFEVIEGQLRLLVPRDPVRE